jgi:hypothetical protein
MLYVRFYNRACIRPFDSRLVFRRRWYSRGVKRHPTKNKSAVARNCKLFFAKTKTCIQPKSALAGESVPYAQNTLCKCIPAPFPILWVKFRTNAWQRKTSLFPGVTPRGRRACGPVALLCRTELQHFGFSRLPDLLLGRRRHRRSFREYCDRSRNLPAGSFLRRPHHFRRSSSQHRASSPSRSLTVHLVP